jgi:hypothetical protein
VFDVENIDHVFREINLQDNAPIPCPKAPLTGLHFNFPQLGMFRVRQELIQSLNNPLSLRSFQTR